MSYKRLRIRRMIDDHNSAGVSPWVRHSYYPYTLDEGQFLKEHFEASDAEIKEFEQQVASAEVLT